MYIQIPGMYTGKNKSARKQRKRCSGAMHQKMYNKTSNHNNTAQA